MTDAANLAHEAARRAARAALKDARDENAQATALASLFDVITQEAARLGVSKHARIDAFTRGLAIAIHNTAVDAPTARAIAGSASLLMHSQLGVLATMKIPRAADESKSGASK